MNTAILRRDTVPLINDYKDLDIFIRQLLNIGEAMYRAGAEIRRVEDSIHRICKAYGAEHANIYATTSSMVITVEVSGIDAMTQSRRITKRESLDFTRIELLNQLCRDCVIEPMPMEQLRIRVKEILDTSADERLAFVGSVLAAMAFTVFFGGGMLEAVISGVGALLIYLFTKYCWKYVSGQVFYNVLVCFITGIITCLICKITGSAKADTVMIGDIMILIPGIAITNSIRYILSGDTISSLEKLVDSVLQAFAIAVGFMLAVYLLGIGVDRTENGSSIGIWIAQIITACIGTFGFGLVFNLKMKHALWTSLAGGLCWLIYLLLKDAGIGIFFCSFLAAAFVGVFSEIAARIGKAPNTVFFIVSCIPLIPGSYLYYTAMACMISDWVLMKQCFNALGLCALGIASGVAVIGELRYIFAQIKESRLNKET